MSVVKLVAAYSVSLLLLTMTDAQSATQPCDSSMVWSIIKDTVDEKVLRRFIDGCEVSEYTSLAQQRIKLIDEARRSPTPGFPTPKTVKTEKINP